MSPGYTGIIAGLCVLIVAGACAPVQSVPAPTPAAAVPTTPAAALQATVTAEPATPLAPAATRGVTPVPSAAPPPTRPAKETAMNATPSPEPFDPGLQSIVRPAQEDLARRTGLPIDEVQVIAVEAVTWPDGSLGCPQPGMAYTQVQVDGVLIRLAAGGREYEYHGGGSRAPFLCEKP